MNWQQIVIWQMLNSAFHPRFSLWLRRSHLFSILCIKNHPQTKKSLQCQIPKKSQQFILKFKTWILSKFWIHRINIDLVLELKLANVCQIDQYYCHFIRNVNLFIMCVYVCNYVSNCVDLCVCFKLCVTNFVLNNLSNLCVLMWMCNCMSPFVYI
jgi:hypothetical protein